MSISARSLSGAISSVQRSAQTSARSTSVPPRAQRRARGTARLYPQGPSVTNRGFSFVRLAEYLGDQVRGKAFSQKLLEKPAAFGRRRARGGGDAFPRQESADRVQIVVIR